MKIVDFLLPMNQTYRLRRTLVSILIIVPVGFYCKFYSETRRKLGQ